VFPSSRVSRIGRPRIAWRNWLLVAVGWLASLGVATAADVKLRWTNPSFSATDSCTEDSTQPLLDLYRNTLTAVRIPEGDTLRWYLPATVDSCVVELADSVHYVIFTMTPEDLSGNLACPGNQELVAVPARDWAPGLKGTYYDNEDLTAPFGSRTDPTISFTWGQGAPLPGMGADLFSEHWEGEIYFPVSGVWSLSAIVEDGWRAWVNGVFVANDFGVQAVHESSCQFQAEAGWTHLVVEAMHHNGNAQMTLSWTPPGGAKIIVPTANLRH